MAEWTEEDDAWLNGDVTTTPKRSKPMGLWQRFRGSFLEGALHNPWGAEGAMRHFGIGRPKDISDEELNRVERRLSDKLAREREADDQHFADVDTFSPANIGRHVVDLLGNMVGGVDPTYILNPGKNAVQRIASQAAINAGVDAGAQGVELKRGVRDEFDWRQTAINAGAGAGFQGASELASRAIARQKGGDLGLDGAVGIGNKFGQVTSTKRSAARNKKVGGAKNSHHLYGRAIDIARGKGVSHKQIERAYRRAGYDIIESLDEGDHSHFAFRFGGKKPAGGGTGRGIMEDFDFRPPEQRGDNFTMRDDVDPDNVDDLMGRVDEEDYYVPFEGARTELEDDGWVRILDENPEGDGFEFRGDTIPAEDGLKAFTIVNRDGDKSITGFWDEEKGEAYTSWDRSTRIDEEFESAVYNGFARMDEEGHGNLNPYGYPRDEYGDVRSFPDKGYRPAKELTLEQQRERFRASRQGNVEPIANQRLRNDRKRSDKFHEEDAQRADSTYWNIRNLLDSVNTGRDYDMPAIYKIRNDLDNAIERAGPWSKATEILNDAIPFLDEAIRTLEARLPDSTEGYISRDPAVIRDPANDMGGKPIAGAVRQDMGKSSLPRNRDELFARAYKEAEAARKANPPEGEKGDNPDAPSAETRKSKPGVNARRMAQMLGPQLYGDPSHMGAVSIKEVLQNSFDAIKTALARGDIELGKIDIKTDKENRTITMMDNGVGMSPDILGGKFLEIAGTGKEEGEASGGFGIAKMLFLYGNDELHVVTVRDGVVSELKTTGPQLFDALEDPNLAPDIDVRPLTEQDLDFAPEGHGTYIRMKLPKDFENPRTHEREEIAFPKQEWDVEGLRESPLFANIEVRFNDYPVDDMGARFPADDYKQFTRVDFGWGDADVYVTKNPTNRRFGKNVHILSNGLWQFSQTMKKNPNAPFGDNLPYKFFIDVHPNVKPDQSGYPFNFNRQQFTPDAKKDFQQVFDYINQLYAMADFSDSAKSFGKVQYIDENGRFSEPQDMTPDIPETNTFGGGIREGDEVTVQEGRLFVNGRQLPSITPEDLQASVPHLDELRIPKEKIDTNKVMVHNNVTVKAWDSFDDDGGVHDSYSGYFPEDMDLMEHMRHMWPGEFDNYLDVVGNEFKYLRDAVAKFPGYESLMDEAIGLSFDPEYRGVSIRIPFSGSFINPLVPESGKIREAALGMIGTMIHELAHFNVRSHNSEFPAEMQRLTYKLLADENIDWFQWQKDFINKVSRYEGVLKYGKKLFDDGRTKVTDSRFKDGAGETRGHEGDDSGDGGQGGAGPGAEPLREDASGGGEPPRGGNGTGEGGGNSGPYDGLSPEDKLLKAIKAAKPLSSEQRKLYHEERKTRGSRISHLQKQGGGLEGYYQELGALRGELPKVNYQSIAEHFTQEDFDALLNKIKANTSLLPYEKINAQTALMKLLGAEGAKVPTKSELRLMSEVFDPKMIDALMLQNLTVRQRIWEGMKNALNLPRSLMASFDLSAPFRQGVFMIGRKQFWTNFATMFKAFGSDAAAKAVQENITTRPTWAMMKKAGLGITTNNNHFLDAREEQFMSSWAEKIPLIGKGVQMSERAYRSFLNKLRADVFDELLEKGQDLGINYHTNKKALKDLARFINAATGRGDLTALLGQGGNAAAPALAGLFFSPRLMASRIQMLNPGFYATLDPMVRKEAIKDLLKFSMAATTVIGLASLSDAVTVETDPRSADFAKIKVGNTRFDPLGGFQQYIRLFSQLITGETVTLAGKERKLGDPKKYKSDTRLDVLIRFFRTKFSPVAAYTADALDGQNIVGEEFNAGKDALESFIPLFIQDVNEAIEEFGAKGVLTAVPAIFGVGVQTYKPRPKKQTDKEFLQDEDSAFLGDDEDEKWLNSK